MKGQELKILFKEDKAFLTYEVALNLKQVQIYDSPVKFKAPAFWTICVIDYNEFDKRLFVEVLDYQVGETEFSFNQIQLADTLIEVEKVNFKSIDTAALFKTLNGTQPIKILPPKQEIVYRPETPIQVERKPIIQTYNEPFSISIKNIIFLNGKVVFEKKVQQLGKIINFEIANENIIEEYDAIKNYFASVLKTKKIQVIPTIITSDGVITSTTATSEEIEKIDETLIEEVKFDLVSVVRRKELSGDKQLFTINEYLETLTNEDFKAQQIFRDDYEFFEILIKKSKTKHYNNLRFLSSKHNAGLQKLRIVHKPFSFVFILNGTNNLHVVWETYDTEEATYVWTFANDIDNLKQVLIRIDKTINLIVRDGKNEYIDRSEENFNRVFHDYTDLQSGFKKWKEEIEKIVS